MNTMNRTLELRQVREVERRFINRNVSNVSSFLFCRVPDEYYEPDFGIEASEGGGNGDLLIETFLTFLLFFFVGCRTNTMNRTLELRQVGEGGKEICYRNVFNVSSFLFVGCRMNTTNRTLELRQVREGKRRFVIETFLTFLLFFL